MTPDTPADGALAEAIAELPMVKPLEWEDFEGLGAKASGFYQANYLIQKWSGESRYEVAMSYPGYQTGYDGLRWHPTLDAAKAAAQADYEARIRAALIPRPAEPARAAQVGANQRRADAATLLLDMLYMRNGAHEGLDRDAVEKMWNAVREDDGFPSVVQFLSVIAAAQDGWE